MNRLDESTANQLAERLKIVEDQIDIAYQHIRGGSYSGVVRAVEAAEAACKDVVQIVLGLEVRLQVERKRAAELLKANGFLFDHLDFIGLQAPVRPEEGEERNE